MKLHLAKDLTLPAGYGKLWIAPTAEKQFGPFDPLPTGSELRAHLLNGSKLESAERKMLGALFETYPTSSSRAQLHDLAGLKPSGDTSSALAKFLKLGWALERDRGLVAADTFFEEA